MPRDKQTIDVQGHRGARGLYPENTITAFLKATTLGVNTLELDVVISGDGKVVVSHEPILNPEICLDPDGNHIPENTVFNLYHMSYDSIAKCDCGSFGHPGFPEQQAIPEHKPLLAEVIQEVINQCQKTGLRVPYFNVEIKANSKYVFLYHPTIKAFVDAAINVLQTNLPSGQFSVQSFDVMTLQYLHEVYPEIDLVYLQEGLGFKSVDEFESDLANLGFLPAIYSCQYTMLTQALVDYAQAKEMRVIPWTINEPDDMRAMLNMGVDGLITDYPDRLLTILGR